jgi:uncharacterized protein (TIGR02145 family)
MLAKAVGSVTEAVADPSTVLAYKEDLERQADELEERANALIAEADELMKREKVKVIKQTGVKHEVIKWVEQEGFVRSHKKEKLEAILMEYRNSEDVRKFMPADMLDEHWEIPRWKHSNGADVCVYDYEAFSDEFWYKLSSLLAASGGVGELSVLQRKEPSREIKKAYDEQNALDRPPKQELEAPARPESIKGKLLDDGLGIRPEEIGLPSYVRLPKTEEEALAEYAFDIPETELPDDIKNELENSVKAFNERREKLSRLVNEMATEVEAEYDLSFQGESWSEEWDLSQDEEEDDERERLADEFEPSSVRPVWYDFTDGGAEYKLVVIGSKQWFAENYRKLKDGAGSGTGGDSGSYGLLYSHGEASAMAGDIAADGWRVPSVDDWNELLWLMNRQASFGLEKSEDNPSPNDSGTRLRGPDFKALAAGMMEGRGSPGKDFGEAAFFIADSFRTLDSEELDDGTIIEKDAEVNPYYEARVGEECASRKNVPEGSEFLLSLRFVRSLDIAHKQTGLEPDVFEEPDMRPEFEEAEENGESEENEEG